jgi:hypothetical protein
VASISCQETQGLAEVPPTAGERAQAEVVNSVTRWQECGDPFS